MFLFWYASDAFASLPPLSDACVGFPPPGYFEQYPSAFIDDSAIIILGLYFVANLWLAWARYT